MVINFKMLSTLIIMCDMPTLRISCLLVILILVIQDRQVITYRTIFNQILMFLFAMIVAFHKHILTQCTRIFVKRVTYYFMLKLIDTFLFVLQMTDWLSLRFGALSYNTVKKEVYLRFY